MYFCFDHGVEYGEDGFMCPACEREICETHDPLHAVLPKNSFNAKRKMELDDDADERLMWQHWTGF